MQELQPFCHDGRGQKAYARDIATGPIEACDQAQCDRVATDGEDDWNGYGCGLCCQRPDVIGRKDHIHPVMNQISRKLGKPIVLISRGAIFNSDVLAFNKIGFLQTPTQSRKARRRLLARSNPEISDDRHGRLLRASGERPRCRQATEQRNKFAPLHVLSSESQPTTSLVGSPRLRFTAKLANDVGFG
jgi:hypothetical protein